MLWAGLLVVGAAIGLGVLVVARGSHASPSRPSTSDSVPTTASPPITRPSSAVPIASGSVAPVFSKIPTTDPVVFFTIDDGLVRDPAVVEFLEKHRIPLTMFLVPDPARHGEAYFKRIQAIGGTVQDHTVHHRDLTKLSSYAQQTEICPPVDEFGLRFGTRPWLFRPPGGKYNALTKGVVRICGLRAIVLWTGATNDGRLDLQHSGPLQPGDIVLMHFRPDLLQNLRVALDAAKAAGLRPARLDEYLTPQSRVTRSEP